MKTNLFVEAIGTVTSLGIGTENAFVGLQSQPHIQSFRHNEKLIFPVSKVTELLNCQDNHRAFKFAQIALDCIERQTNKPINKRDKTALLIGCTKGESFAISQVLQKKEPDLLTYMIASSNLINTKLSTQYELPFIPVPNAACATGAQILQKSALLLNEKKFTHIIACMTEASLTPELIGAFHMLGVLTNNINGTAPFNKNHHGFHIGEGAVALLLSLNKSPNSWGQALGAASATDAQNFTTFPNGPHIVWETIQNLCKSCDVKLSEINHVTLHGTGTLANDFMELALSSLFIKENKEVSFSTFKPFPGHLLGASGLSEFALSLICAQNSWLPPILNTQSKDASLPPHFILEPTGRQKEVNYFINLSYGLGSTIGVILGKK